MSHRVLVTGGGGLLGYALRQLCPDAVYLTRRDGDLTDPIHVKRLFDRYAPERVIHLAAVVGGVKKNAEDNADLFTANVLINTNVLTIAQQRKVSRLISVLSSCVFAEALDRPPTEADIHHGMPFEGNLGYGYAKRMLDVQTRLLWMQDGCRFSTITPATMYGPNDNWDLEGGHVIGALIHRCVLAKQQRRPLEVWGTGEAVRQFVYSFDVARLILRALEAFDGPETVIVVPDDGLTIRTLVQHITTAVQFAGPVVFRRDQPEGQRVKVIRSTRCAGLFPGLTFTPLEEGLKATVQWFLEQAPGPKAGAGRVAAS